ncbi:sensor domain-containing diguanylate cyclase [Vibrio ostreicida]|uniref:diguanylate cyclase n=2 Tax=Vibrio ostreicida TaxID=526588 RepID=A0ABT8BZL3_9VIBR|nr:sensor domain-containing diguanylate cyclase [Vibrio ostreicida]MDN3611794.1 sensor domain-containing diguanylate cyclase [Vibrio ostreicida]NPD09609.1 sensor domain-containing diguanylate cyclase [Vibrio ostreicida]
MFRIIQIVILAAMVSAAAAKVADPTPLVVTNSKAWKPFSYLDDRNQPAGILVDYWKEYARINNVEVEFLLLDWNESLEAVKSGRADLHAGLLWSEQRDSFFDYTPSIMTIDTQMYISQSLIGLDLNEFMLGEHDFQVGVVEGGYEADYTRLHYPNLNLITFTNNQIMIDAAFNGEIQAFVADLQVASYYLLSSHKSNAFIGVRHLYSGDLRSAVAEGNRELQNQVRQGQALISDDEKRRIFSRWMHINTVYPAYLAPLLIAIAVLLAVSYILVLKVTVKAKTRQLAVANQELKVLSETDYLTGLSNRRHFVEEFHHCLTKASHVCVMVFDIDDFKKINDRYGHHVGDWVIQKVAQTIQNYTGPDDLLGRIGGEEFALVVSNQDELRIKKVSQTICELIRNIDFGGEPDHKVTVSLGCAYYPRSSADIPLSDADHLMYEAKALGKDRVVIRKMAS